MKNQNIRGLKPINSFEGLKIGDCFLAVSNQFKAANRIELVSFDNTGLNRSLAYFNYTDTPKEPTAFCIWGHDLNENYLLFPYIF